MNGEVFCWVVGLCLLRKGGRKLFGNLFRERAGDETSTTNKKAILAR